jgi:hypothetical protein
MDKIKPQHYRRWPALLYLLLIVAVTLIPTFPATAQDDDPPPMPDPRFGVIEAYHEPDLADQLGIGWERIIFYWSELEKQGPDDWNWFHHPTAVLDREIEGGREIVGVLEHTPAWATKGIPGAGVPYGLYRPLDDPTNYWARFVRRAVRSYQGRIHRWVIWNEPDISLDTYGTQWQGTTEDYYQLVKTAYIVAHEVDPDIVIHLGGLTYWHNPNYLREYLTVASQDPTAAANGYYFDVISVHIYFRPDTTLEIINTIQTTLEDFGLGDKPIWINETNAPPYDDPAQEWINPPFQVTQEMQASFLLQEFALALSTGVERIAVYKWIDEPPPAPGFEPYGLLRPDRSPRPAYEAFRAIMQYYTGTQDAVLQESAQHRTVILQRGERTTRAIWARRPYRVVTVVPALADSALLVDRTGTKKTIHPLLGHYILTLEGAPCQPFKGCLLLDNAACQLLEGCLMDGSPLLLVEDAPVNLAESERLRSRLVVAVALLLALAVAAAGLGLVAVLALRRKKRV